MGFKLKEKTYLEDNNHTEEIDPRYETKDGEDTDVVRVVQPEFSRAPEYCHHDPDLKGSIILKWVNQS